MKKIIGFLNSRRAKRGSVSLLIVLLFTAVIIGVNFAATALQNAFPALSVDMTSSNVFRLSNQTKEFLNSLQDDVIITVLADEEKFIANGAYFNQANAIVRQIAAKSPKITLRYIDYENDKTLQTNYPDVTLSTSSVFLIESSAHYCVLDVSDIFNISVNYTTYTSYITSSKAEQALVTGILSAVSEELKKAVFIKGKSDADYSAIYDVLKQNAYRLDEVMLAASNLPDDADMVILYAPAADLDKKETEKLRAFLNSGGKTLIYISNYDKTDIPNTNALLEEYGLSLMSGVMYETDSSMIAYADNPYMSIVSYNDEIFYNELKNRSIPFVSPYTRAVEVLNSKAAVMLYASVKSAVFPYDADKSFDIVGAVTGSPVVAAAVGKNNDSNIVVFGSSDAFASSVLTSTAYNNSAYFATVCNELSQRDSSFNIIIESKSMDDGAITIKYQSVSNTIRAIFSWALPLLMLIAAAAVLIIRRRK